jgi:hypothetical protein
MGATRTAPLVPVSQSSKVQVIEQVEVDLEVDNQVDLPQTGQFGEDFVIQVDNKSVADSEEMDIEGRSVNLLDKEGL